MTDRPTVAVVMPFAGRPAELAAARAALERLDLGPGDEVVLADNVGTARADPRATDATGVRSPGFARNRGAAATSAEWLVFLDADTLPAADLLDRYFDPPPAPGTAVLAGAIVDVAGGGSRAAHHAARRRRMSEQLTLRRDSRPYGLSANLAVRRTAFDAVQGFAARARAGEDADLCWRLADAGWGLERRPSATVEHVSRATARRLLAQLARHGAGAAWLEGRYPGAFPAPDAVRLVRRLAHHVRRGELLDAAETLAFEAGRRLVSNEARPR